MYSIIHAGMPAGQKGTPDLIRDGCEPPHVCCELNSGPLEEQPVLLTTESCYLNSPDKYLKKQKNNNKKNKTKKSR